MKPSAFLANLRVALGLEARPQPLPAGWKAILAAIPQAAPLDAAQRERYEQRVEQFLRDKHFTGCGGFEVTDQVRALIAGLACLLVLRPGAKVFPELRSVLVYPDAFLVPQAPPDADELGLVDDEPQEHLGMSWGGDRVILSWADVEAALQGDEINVVAHEFAHQLDDETPDIAGAPALRDYARWEQVMRREYERLRRHRRPPVLDAYGAESPEEFFGVVTEAYFQRGAELLLHHAELYALLRDHYGIDTTRISFPQA